MTQPFMGVTKMDAALSLLLACYQERGARALEERLGAKKAATVPAGGTWRQAAERRRECGCRCMSM